MGDLDDKVVMDDRNTARRMVEESPLTRNSKALALEFGWLDKIIETRLRLNSGAESQCRDIFHLSPPKLARDSSMFGYFVNHYDMGPAERVVFAIGLLPHVKPGYMEAILSGRHGEVKAAAGLCARTGISHPGLLPTGETALFILAGDDLEKRLSFTALFEAGHFFTRHDILSLTGTEPCEPRLNGYLTLSREVVDLVTTGAVSGPAFGIDFPAKRIETLLEWDDLVLDDFSLNQALEIKDWVEYGDLLLDDLMLGKRIKPGFRSLFYGPPGTGKTLAATLLGKLTGRDVYRIDLSMVVSKYIGETEKNLEKVFRQAEHKDWILFFDEADALFSKRTSVNTAHDRFANQEISYLLQRVEDYPGVVILASNLKQNLDEAFTRRFQSIIHFPMPGAAERLRIWEKAFSEKTSLDKEIDLRDIAERYELSGGSITNVVRYATLKAVKKGTRVIGADCLLEGIRKEFQKEGRTS